MVNGRPADGSFQAYFCMDRIEENVDLLETQNDDSGWQGYSIQVDSQAVFNGKGKLWNDDGSIYVGEWKDSNKTEGKKYELQADGTHTLYYVKYDEKGEEI